MLAFAAVPGRLGARVAARRLQSTFIVTAVGTDRVGLVADVTKSVAAHGGSLSQSQMLRLGGSFALLARITLSDELRRFDLEGALASELGLKAMVEPALGEASAAIEAGPPMFDAVVRLDGADHPGLVARVAEFVSARGLAIEKLETALDTAPFGGTTLFQMSCRVTSRECVALDAALCEQIHARAPCPRTDSQVR